MPESCFPILYKRTATGAIQYWQIRAVDTTIVTRFGQVDGKIQTTKDVIKSGKNQGRKNETGVEEQALLEAQSRWEKKKKSGYVGSISEAQAGKVDKAIEGGVVPMLAKVYEDHSKKLKFPVAVQPKLDGSRCLAVIDEGGAVSLWSRTRKRILSCDHIAEKISVIAQKKKWTNVVLDGEIYLHGKDNFEELMSATRKNHATPESQKLQYHVYDCVREEAFEDRLAFLSDLIILGGSMVFLVPTKLVDDEPEVLLAHDEYVEDGYEGVMVRSLSKGYEHKRSDQLLKLKKFHDEEFEIVGLEEGRGKLAGHCGAFVCKTGDQTFNVKMSGELSTLKEFWENKEDLIGQWITVKFQSKTVYGVPRFPVGLRIRNDL